MVQYLFPYYICAGAHSALKVFKTNKSLQSLLTKLLVLLIIVTQMRMGRYDQLDVARNKDISLTQNDKVSGMDPHIPEQHCAQFNPSLLHKQLPLKHDFINKKAVLEVPFYSFGVGPALNSKCQNKRSGGTQAHFRICTTD